MRLNRFRIMLFALAVPMIASAQNKTVCTQEKISSLAVTRGRPVADDQYFAPSTLEKPAVGLAERRKESAAIEAQRRNEKDTFFPEQIVIGKAGDMAYEYGTVTVNYDEAATSKHVAIQESYLRVWKDDKGICKVAAIMTKR